jgi:hypothetical protein
VRLSQKHDIPNTHRTKSKPCFHRWRHAQSLLNPHEIVIDKVQANRMNQILNFYREGIRQARESTHVHPLKVETLLHFQEAIKNPQALHANGRRVSESLRDLATWVSNAFSATHNFDPMRDFWSEGRHANILCDQQDTAMR